MGEAADITQLTMAFFCQQRLYELNTEFLTPGGNKLAVRKRFQEFWPHARRVFQWCADRIETDVRAALACDKIAGVAGQLLEQERGRHQLIDWREVAVRGTDRAIASGKVQNSPEFDLVHDMLGHLTYLGYLHYANGNPVRARQTLERALQFGEEHDRHFADGVALLHLAFVAITEGELSEGEAFLQKALATIDDSNRSSMEGSTRIALGVVYGRDNKPDAACAEYDRAIPVFEAANNQSGLCMALINRGGELLNRGLRDLAHADFMRAEAIAGDLGSPGHIALLQANVIRLNAQDHPEEGARAFELLRESKARFASIGDRVQHARIVGMLEQLYQSVLDRDASDTVFAQRKEALWELGNLAEERGDSVHALELAKKLLAESVASGQDEDQLEALTHVAHRNILTQNYTAAQECAARALSLFDRIRSSIEPERAVIIEYELRAIAGQCLRHSGDCKGAVREYRAALALATFADNPERIQELRGNLGLALADDGCFEEALTLLQSVAEKLQLSDDYRLAGRARFNVAYALHLQCKPESALSEANAALDLLDLIADPMAEEVRRQVADWKK